MSYFEPMPISVVSKFLRIDNKKLHDFLRTEHGKLFFETYHPEYQGSKSLETWVRVNRINLIKCNAHLQPTARERVQCLKMVANINGFCHFNKKKRKTEWDNDVYFKIQKKFLDYKSRVSHKSLVLIKDPSKPDNFFAPAKVIPYSTRFTDKNKQRAKIAEYLSLWENAGLTHDKGLLITITNDPNNFDNLIDTNKSHNAAINDLITTLRARVEAEIKRYPDFEMLNQAIKRGVTLNYDSLKGLKDHYIRKLYEQYRRNHPEVSRKEFKDSIIKGSLSHSDLKAIILEGYKISSHFKKVGDYVLKYINVLEFQFNGRLHSHIPIFGIDYLMDVHELSRLCVSKGLGKIVHAYGLKKDAENKWTWKNPNNTPKDSRNKNPVDYLKVYLLKGQYATACNYWVFGSRFFTNSRNFEPIEERTRKAILRKQRRLAPRMYVYAGTITDHSEQFDNIRYIDNKDYLKIAKDLLAYKNSVPGAVSVS